MGKSAPKPPNLQPIADAQMKIAEQMNGIALEQLGLSKEQFAYFKEQGAAELAFAKEQAAKNLELQDRAIATGEAGQKTQAELVAEQKKLMEQAYGFSEEDRARYNEVAIPLQDRIIAEANAWDSPERQAEQAAMRLADVQRQSEAQQRNVDARLAGMGIDPSQMRAGAIANTMALQTAAAGAQQANTGRQEIQQQGIAMRGQAANMLAGLPTQGAQQQQIASGAGGAASNTATAGENSALNGYAAGAGYGNNAVGLRGSALNNMASWTGTPMQWAGMGNQSMGNASNSYMNSANVLNSGYQNQLDRFNAQSQATAGMVSSLGALAGGVAAFADGGDVGYFTEGGKSDEETFSQKWDKKRADWKEKSGWEKSQAILEGFDAAGDTTGSGIPTRQRRPGTDIEAVYYADGGGQSAVPPRQSVDRIPAVLSAGEYVVPADVVRALGTKHFDKLVDRYHKVGA